MANTGKNLLALLLLILLAFPAGAAMDSWDTAKSRERCVVIGEGGDSLTISLAEGARIRIVSTDGVEEVVEVDLSGIEDIVEVALAQTKEIFADLAEMQIEMKLGSENSFTLYDGETEVFVDLEAIMAGVGRLLAEVCEDINYGYDDHTGGTLDEKRTYPDDGVNADKEDLQKELDELREELSRLRTELRHQRQRQ